MHIHSYICIYVYIICMHIYIYWYICKYYRERNREKEIEKGRMRHTERQQRRIQYVYVCRDMALHESKFQGRSTNATVRYHTSPVPLFSISSCISPFFFLIRMWLFTLCLSTCNEFFCSTPGTRVSTQQGYLGFYIIFWRGSVAQRFCRLYTNANEFARTWNSNFNQ